MSNDLGCVRKDSPPGLGHIQGGGGKDSCSHALYDALCHAHPNALLDAHLHDLPDGFFHALLVYLLVLLMVVLMLLFSDFVGCGCSF